MCFSVLASSVIIVATRSGLLPSLSVLSLGLRFHVPELFSDALFFGRYTFLKDEIPLNKSPDLCEGCISLLNGEALKCDRL